MQDESESAFYLGGGPMAAILLGMALVPWRGLTTASNFTFLFLALTIAVAEFGGRWAAVATALVSALSLDFFLTEPYLRLSIASKHDLIAFLGLAACGLIAAALGAQRGQRIAELKALRSRVELFRSSLEQWDPALPVEPRLEKLLRRLRDCAPLGALALRNPAGQVIATSDSAAGLRSIPAGASEVGDLVLPGATSGAASFPDSGTRIAVRIGTRQLGWLDIWGNGLPARPESRQTLADAARLIAALLAGGERQTRERA